MSTNPTIESIRRDRGALEAEIRAAGSTIRGTGCNCPHPDHEDRNPSASICCGSDGVWRVKCFSRNCFGGAADVFDLRAALTGRLLADVLRQARGDTKPSHVASAPPSPDMTTRAKAYYQAITDQQRQDLADRLGLSAESLRRLRCGWFNEWGVFTFPMRDASGSITGVRTRNHRSEKKAIPGSTAGLFIPIELQGGALFIVEGPTDTAALLDCGLDTIGRPSNTGGEDLIVEYLRRNPRQQVVILADRDDKDATAAKTMQAAERLAARLTSIDADVRIIQPPEGVKDARAWRRSGANRDDIEAAADAAMPRGPAEDLRLMLADEIDGTRSSIAWPWRMLTRGSQALIPGTITLVVGDPGSGKSLFLLEALAHWHDARVRAGCYMLERSRAEHLKRALAQRVGASWLTDLEAVKDRPGDAMAYEAEHRGWIGDFGRTIFEAPEKITTMADLARWTEQRAAEGHRIIAIDPITIAKTTARPWDDAQRFMQATGRAIEQHGASLVIVTHPAKTRNGRGSGLRTLDDLAGGSAWARFADSVLWIERHDEPKTVTLKDFGGSFPLPFNEQINRTVRIMKARNGRGAGWQLGYGFDPQTLRFEEHGAIVRPTAVGVDS